MVSAIITLALFKYSAYFLYAGFFNIILFLILYGFRSAWYRYPEGRSLFVERLSLAGVISVSVAFLLLVPTYALTVQTLFPPGLEVWRFAAYVFFFAATLWRLIDLIKAQHRDRKELERKAGIYDMTTLSDNRSTLVNQETTESTEPIPVRIVKKPGHYLTRLRNLFR